MVDAQRILLDDRLLIEELLASLARPAAPVRLSTTTYWYYRACRAAIAGAGGHLSGPFELLEASQQAHAILSLLALTNDIALPDPRATVPVMADIANRHPRLNLLNLEAVAAARTLSASVWLSEQSAAGILPSVLDAEGIPWDTIAVR